MSGTDTARTRWILTVVAYHFWSVFCCWRWVFHVFRVSMWSWVSIVGCVLTADITSEYTTSSCAGQIYLSVQGGRLLEQVQWQCQCTCSNVWLAGNTWDLSISHSTHGWWCGLLGHSYVWLQSQLGWRDWTPRPLFPAHWKRFISIIHFLTLYICIAMIHLMISPIFGSTFPIWTSMCDNQNSIPTFKDVIVTLSSSH